MMTEPTPNILRAQFSAAPVYLRGRHRSVYLARYQQQMAITQVASAEADLLPFAA